MNDAVLGVKKKRSTRKKKSTMKHRRTDILFKKHHRARNLVSTSDAFKTGKFRVRLIFSKLDFAQN